MRPQGIAVMGRILTGLAGAMAAVYYPTIATPGVAPEVLINTLLNPIAWLALVFAGVAQSKGQGYRTKDKDEAAEFWLMLLLLGACMIFGVLATLAVSA